MIIMTKDRVLLLPEEIKTKSGIIIPDMVVRDKSNIGKVVSVGELCETKVGDRVIYKATGVKIEEHTMINESDILAVIL